MSVNSMSPKSGRYLDESDKAWNVIDLRTGVIGVIESEHAMVHRGQSYAAEFIQEALADNGVIYIHITAGATKWVHMHMSMNVIGKFYVKTYAGATYTDIGTPADGIQLTQFNKIVGDPIGEAIVRYAPIVDVLGNLRAQFLLPGGTGPHAIGSSGASDVETIIKANGDLLIELTNKSGQARDVDFNLVWYEP